MSPTTVARIASLRPPRPSTSPTSVPKLSGMRGHGSRVQRKAEGLMSMLHAHEVRARLAFHVERLSVAAQRLEGVDARLSALRAGLEARASALAGDAMASVARDGSVQIKRAQAHATA